MGYTHYWDMKTFNKEDEKGWMKSLLIIRNIVNRYKDILCLAWNNSDSEPQVTSDSICFNGKDDDGCEAFIVLPKKTDFDFCKTRYKPYDIAICECLLVLSHFIPSFYFRSDGSYTDLNWQKALNEVENRYGFGIDKHKSPWSNK